MRDKLEIAGDLKHFLSKLDNILVYLQEDMSLLKMALKRQEVDSPLTEEIIGLAGIKWHCLHCGHTWEGHVKTNPTTPGYCAKCKNPKWDEIPSGGINGLHKTPDGKRCKRCLEAIQSKLEVLKRLKQVEELENFVKE